MKWGPYQLTVGSDQLTVGSSQVIFLHCRHQLTVGSAYIVVTSWEPVSQSLCTLSSAQLERGCCNFVLDGRGSVQTTDWIVLPPVANRCILIVAELRELMKSPSPWNIMFFDSVILLCLMFSSLVLILFTVLLNFLEFKNIMF